MRCQEKESEWSNPPDDFERRTGVVEELEMQLQKSRPTRGLEHPLGLLKAFALPLFHSKGGGWELLRMLRGLETRRCSLEVDEQLHDPHPSKLDEGKKSEICPLLTQGFAGMTLL